MNRKDLQLLAEERLIDARTLLARGRYGAAYYIVGYAVECGVKACIAKRTRAEDFYDKILANKIFTHNFAQLANLAGLTVIIDELQVKDKEFGRNWAQVSLWSEESRYDPHTQREATQLVDAVAEPNHGVLKCIKQHW